MNESPNQPARGPAPPVEPPIPPSNHPAVAPPVAHGQPAPPSQPSSDHTDILGIVSIILPFIGLAIVGFVLGIIGASKAKRERRSPILSRIGWIISLAIMIITTLLFIVLVVLAINHQNDASQGSDGSLSTMVDANSRKEMIDGFSLVVPNSFTDVPAEDASKDASLTQGDDATSQYVLVIKESRLDFSDTMNVQGYADLVNKNYESGGKLENAVTLPLPSVPNPLNYTVTDYEVDGLSSDTKIVFYIRYIATADNFYQIATWTTPSKVSEAKPVLFKILESFKEE